MAAQNNNPGTDLNQISILQQGMHSQIEGQNMTQMQESAAAMTLDLRTEDEGQSVQQANPQVQNMTQMQESAAAMPLESRTEDEGQSVQQANPQKPDLTLLLLGKTGNGKSSTANTILDESSEAFPQEYFKVSCGSSSETKSVEVLYKNLRGRKVNAIDTPGTCDTKKSHKEVLRELATVVATHPEGLDAFIVVMVYGNRMTEEERLAAELLRKLFSPEIFNYGICLFTNGGLFHYEQRRQQKKGNEPLAFQQVILKDRSSTEEDAIAPYVLKFKGGTLLFNNLEEDPQKRREMVATLLDKVDKIHAANGGKRYTDHLFNKAKQWRKERADRKLPIDTVTIAERLVEYIEKYLDSIGFLQIFKSFFQGKE